MLQRFDESINCRALADLVQAIHQIIDFNAPGSDNPETPQDGAKFRDLNLEQSSKVRDITLQCNSTSVNTKLMKRHRDLTTPLVSYPP